MSKDGADCSQVPRFIVSPFMVKQPGCVLPPGTVIKSIPIQVGSFVLGPPNKQPHPAHTEPSAYSMNVFQDLKTFDVKVSTKGRRPKHAVSEKVDRGCELRPGNMTERPMCNTCGKYFMSRQQLNQHMLVHTDVRKYKCTFCDRTFKQPSHLHQHHRIHTGEKPYKCPIPGCLRAFPQQSNLNHHLRNHDKPAPPPENTCSLCMRTYASETVLRSHISKIHMCDPDALLGLRIKTPLSDFSRSSNSVKDVPANSARVSDSRTTEETNNNERVQQQTVLDKMNTQMSVLKQEANNQNNEQSSHFALKLNAGNKVPDFKQDDTELYIHGNSRQSLMNENITKSIYINGTKSYNEIPETDGDTLNHFIEGTNQRHSSFDDNNDVRNNHDDYNDVEDNNGRTYASETSFISGLKLPVSIHNPSHNQNEGELTEIVPLQIGRSRKRKAFQPQRIVKTQNANN